MGNKQTFRIDGLNSKTSGLTYLMCFIFIFLASFILGGAFNKNTYFSNIGSYLLAQIAFVFALIVGYRASDFSFKQLITIKLITIKKKTTWKIYIICSVLVISLCLLMTNFVSMFEYLIKLTGYKGIESAVIMDEWWQLLLNILVIGVVPALVEETVFRGIIYNGMREISEKAAIILSSVFFMLIHGGIYQTVYQFMLGLIFVLAYKATKDLKLPIVMHFVNNVFILIFTYFAGEGETLSRLTLTNAIVSTLMFFASIGLIIGWYFLMKKLTNKKETGVVLTIQENEEKQNTKEETENEEKKIDKSYLIVSFCVAMVYFILSFVLGF